MFGVSGSGKTTVLRAIAGLERTRPGRVIINGEVWQDEEATGEGRFLPTHRRPVGVVFQEANLFPHLTVRRNLEYGFHRVPITERRVDFSAVVEWLGIEELLPRSPIRLSGGERQRVAIARALLTSPRLLLMDEPLSALDRAAKAEILPYLERLPSELSIPVLYVSHSPDEVAQLADYLVLLEAGRVRAQGPVAELFARPDLPLAHDPTAEALIQAVVESHDEDYHLTWLRFPGGKIAVSRQFHESGTPMQIRIHARDVSLTLAHCEETSILNIFPVTVIRLFDDGPAQVLVHLDAAGQLLLARITRRSAVLLGLIAGKTLYAQVKSVTLMD
ncbi:Molybdenum import ATP-binding protein ModC 1 [Gammaproteobacteria bacterium]